MSGFMFKFRLKYSDPVERLLYNYPCENLDVPNHAFQYKSPERAVCLLCKTSLTVPLCPENLIQHVESDTHQGLTNTEAFDSYHEIFMKLDDSEQYMQLYFSPLNHRKLHCELCKEDVSVDNIHEHVNTALHKGVYADFWDCNIFSPKEVVDSLNLTPEYVTEGSAEDSYLTSDDVTEESADDSNLTIKDVTELHNAYHNLTIKGVTELPVTDCNLPPKDVTELPVDCNLTPKKVPVDYSPKEAACDSTLIVVEEVPVDYLSLKPEDVAPIILKQLALKNSPLVYNKVGKVTYCLICQREILGTVGVHVNTQRHLNMSTKLDSFRLLTKYHEIWLSQPVEARVKRKYFSPLGMKQLRCLICSSPVEIKMIIKHTMLQCKILTETDPLYEPELRRMVMSEINMTYAQDIKMMFYPEPLMKEIQMVNSLSVYTIQRQLQNSQCLLCQRFMEGLMMTADIIKHVTSDRHRYMETQMGFVEPLHWYHQFWMSQPDVAQAAQRFFKPCKVGTMVCLKCYARLDEYKIYVHLTKPCRKSDLSAGSSRSSASSSESIGQTEMRAPVPVEVATTSRDSTPGRPLRSITEYDNDTLSTVYPNYNNVTKARRPSLYFMQKRSNIECYCLICKAKIIGIPIDHVRSKNHLRQASLGSVNRLLASYHKFWMAQIPDHQLLQIYFNPLNDSTFRCDVCNNGVQHRHVLEHRCLSLEVKYPCLQVSETYRIIDLTYGDKTTKKFFSKSLIEATKLVLNTNLPLGLHFNHKFYCFFCGAKIFRDLGRWNKHITGHCSNVEQLERRLALILEFHRFWEAQSEEMQICMVHYVPEAPGFMRCASRHVLLYEDFFEHMKYCQVQHWDKLLDYMEIKNPLYDRTSSLSVSENDSSAVEQPNSRFVNENGCSSDTDSVVSGRNSTDNSENECTALKESVILKEVAVLQEEAVPKDDDVLKEEAVSKEDGVRKDEAVSKEDDVLKEEAIPKAEGIPKGETIPKKVENAGAKPKKAKKASKNDAVNAVKPPMPVVHEIISSVEIKESDDVFDILPNRFKPHLCNLKKLGDKLIHCDICQASFGCTPLDILLHITGKNHTSVSQVKIERRVFYCDVCMQTCKNETKWIYHMSSNHHNYSSVRLPKKKLAGFQEYECLTCHCIIFGDTQSLLLHMSLSKLKSGKKKAQVVLKAEVKELFKSENATESMAIKLRKDILSNEVKTSKSVSECLKGFESALVKHYPFCKAYPFGSRVTGIGSSKSDLDVFFDIGDMYYGCSSQKIQQDIVLKVKKILSKDRRNFSEILAITSARTPIIRVVHNITDIDCDLSFRHGLSVENTKFISFCFDLQPITRLAMLILKRWADIINLKDEVTSYALCMMFIFYMQMNGYLISVQKLRELTLADVCSIDGWDIIEYTKSAPELIGHVQIYEGTVFKLLQGFFKMYEEFDFDKNVVCPLLGKPIQVKSFDKLDSLPVEMKKFGKRLKMDPECKFKISSVCVQDPFDLGHNLTKAVFKSYREKFTTLCNLTYQYMETVL